MRGKTESPQTPARGGYSLLWVVTAGILGLTGLAVCGAAENIPVDAEIAARRDQTSQAIQIYRSDSCNILPGLGLCYPKEIAPMAFTVGAIGAITFIRLRSPPDSDGTPHLTRRLLESQKRRRGGTSNQDQSGCLPD